ncbi:MAG: hypothetical protein JSR34_10945 [Proteobacteria bacterium]|nr:hypothetical protein [Pseudomonadota bacterium]
MSNYLYVLVVLLLIAFVVIVISRAMGKHDIPHPHHDADGGQKADPQAGEGDNRGR